MRPPCLQLALLAPCALLAAGFARSAPAGEPTFFRGVNVNGDAMTVDGRRWAGADADWFRCAGRGLEVKPLELDPPAGEAVATMLHSFCWHQRVYIELGDVPAGLYSVRLYILEDNAAETFDIYVEDRIAARGYDSGAAGTWRKTGPWAVEVRDGTLDIRTRGGAANICGIEVWRGRLDSATTLPARPDPPESPYLGKLDDRKPRLMVLTDIGGDPDDRQSLARFLLYSCDFDVEGLCTGLGWGHKRDTREDLVHEAIDAYAEVVDRLREHRKDYPSPDSLRSLVKAGRDRGMHEVGEGMNSEASDWIIEVLRRDDPRPVWFTVWGGPRELAQALWKMERTLSAEAFQAVRRKIRVHSIADQDDTAVWVKRNHPEVWWLYSDRMYRGMWKGGNQAEVSPAWLSEHVLEDHGPLGDVYPPQAAGKRGVKEGDTPSFLYVLRNGLSDPEAPHWGSWGGRFEYSGDGHEFVPAGDLREGQPDVLYSIFRWRSAYQNAFEARMDWCVQPYSETNHEPAAVCNGDRGAGVLHEDARPGDAVQVSAEGSSDPDGDALSYRWWIYGEPSTFDARATLHGAAKAEASLTVPEGGTTGDIHVILEITDDGDPPLTTYRRLIVHVR